MAKKPKSKTVFALVREGKDGIEVTDRGDRKAVLKAASKMLSTGDVPEIEIWRISRRTKLTQDDLITVLPRAVL